MSKLLGAKRIQVNEGSTAPPASDARSLAQRRVERAIQQMREPLAARYHEIREVLRASVGDTARARHRVGEVTLQVMTDTAKYGKRAVALLASALGRNEDTLYSWARVAETWPRHDFDVLARRHTVHGVPLSIAHLVAIAGAKSDDDRRRLVDEAIEHGLTAKALVRLVERERSEDASSSELDEDAATGRRLLTRMSATAATALKRVSRLAASFEAVPEDELQDPEFVHLLETSVERHRELVKGMSEAVQGLESRLRRLRGAERATTQGGRRTRRRAAEGTEEVTDGI